MNIQSAEFKRERFDKNDLQKVIATWPQLYQFLSNFKWPEDPLNLVEIKNPYGSFHYNPPADAWWVEIFFLDQNLEFLNNLAYVYATLSIRRQRSVL